SGAGDRPLPQGDLHAQRAGRARRRSHHRRAGDGDRPGRLTVHGVPAPSRSPWRPPSSTASWVTGSVDVAPSDFDVTAPTAPIVLSVADTATVELQLYLSPAS